jgi:hypothetical protein
MVYRLNESALFAQKVVTDIVKDLQETANGQFGLRPEQRVHVNEYHSNLENIKWLESHFGSPQQQHQQQIAAPAANNYAPVSATATQLAMPAPELVLDTPYVAAPAPHVPDAEAINPRELRRAMHEKTKRFKARMAKYQQQKAEANQLAELERVSNRQRNATPEPAQAATPAQGEWINLLHFDPSQSEPTAEAPQPAPEENVIDPAILDSAPQSINSLAATQAPEAQHELTGFELRQTFPPSLRRRAIRLCVRMNIMLYAAQLRHEREQREKEAEQDRQLSEALDQELAAEQLEQDLEQVNGAFHGIAMNETALAGFNREWTFDPLFDEVEPQAGENADVVMEDASQEQATAAILPSIENDQPIESVDQETTWDEAFGSEGGNERQPTPPYWFRPTSPDGSEPANGQLDIDLSHSALASASASKTVSPAPALQEWVDMAAPVSILPPQAERGEQAENSESLEPGSPTVARAASVISIADDEPTALDAPASPTESVVSVAGEESSVINVLGLRDKPWL